jgi:predicted  nucleic acid-binding Zn-ribbon protein
VNQQIEDALSTIVKLTAQSGNMKKELKKSINETVSNLRNLIINLKDNLNVRTTEASELRNEVKGLREELVAHRNPQTARQVALSIGSPPY